MGKPVSKAVRPIAKDKLPPLAKERPKAAIPTPASPVARTPASVSVSFDHADAGDYNFVHPAWEGPLPAVGHLVTHPGRTTIWEVVSVEWVLGVDRSTRTLSRGVTIKLEQAA